MIIDIVMISDVGDAPLSFKEVIHNMKCSTLSIIIKFDLGYFLLF